MNDRPVDASLANQLAALISEARSGDVAFEPAAAKAQQLASVAGPAQSESWIAAQEALTWAVAAKLPTAKALGDIDTLGGNHLQANGGLAPSDLAVIKQAGAEVSAIDRHQAATIKSIQASLAR